jgi:stearoyl-CoA desaturase (delta-9 desaturase)
MERELRQGPKLKSITQFAVFHLVPLFALMTGATSFDWWLCLGMYYFRMFWITGGYHRYFSHKTYKTSRWFQFLIAFFAESSVQKGVLWWGAHHRHHHKTSDTPADPHSMKIYGFWYSHIGWISGPEYKETDFKAIQDYAKFPEIRWIDKHYTFPVFVTMFAVLIVGGFVNSEANDLGWLTLGGGAWSLQGGLSSMFIGFFLSTAILFHGTFSINSIMHKIGNKRYESGDESRNSLILALVTLGEGWHNNHHYYMSSTRQGFFWWEIDLTYYVLKMFSFVGLVWDIQEVPKHIKDSRNMKEARELLNKYKNAAKANMDLNSPTHKAA